MAGTQTTILEQARRPSAWARALALIAVARQLLDHCGRVPPPLWEAIEATLDDALPELPTVLLDRAREARR